jgi:RNA polymerase sigma-B factor
MPIEQQRRDNQYDRLMPLFTQLGDPAIPRQRREHIRETLLAGYLPLAEHIARRYRNRGQPHEDLEQVARVGLVLAVDRFDPTRGTDFVSFAVPTITGEVRRYFRDMTWALGVPRRLKELRTSVGAAAMRLAQETGRSPRPQQIATKLGISVEEVYEGLQAGYAYRTEPLEPYTRDDSPELERQARLGRVDKEIDLVEDRTDLYPALARLPDRERSIVIMRFFENLTQTEIGQRLGISQMHVSRLLAQSLAMLRADMAVDQ